MKLFTALLALMAFTLPAAADIAKRNVPTLEGVYATGFMVIGGSVDYFVTPSTAAKYTFAKEVTVLPVDVDPYRADEVAEYLEGLGYTDVKFPLGSRCAERNILGDCLSREPTSWN